MIKKIKSYVKKNKALLVVSDLDGTLLNSKGELTKYTIQVIKKFIKQGNIFCLATARPFRSTSQIYEQLGLKSICVNYNGASMDNPYDKYFSGINYMFSVDIAKTILNDPEILSEICNIVIENENKSYIWKEYKSKQKFKRLLDWFHIKNLNNIVFGDEIRKIQFNPHTINLIIPIKSNSFVINKLMSLYETLNIKIYEMDSKYRVIEIGVKIANKGHALEYLSAFYGIDISHTIAFGDTDNDIELLQTARFSFAMSNGTNTAKSAAKFITLKSNDNNGVAKTLLSFIK